MQIVINEGYVEVAHNGKVNGIVYIKDGDFIFPSERWIDYILLHLDWWGQSFENIVNNGENGARFEFFDGPFYWELHRKKKWVASFYEGCKLIHQVELDDVFDLAKAFLISSKEYCSKVLNTLSKQPNQGNDLFQEGLNESIEICKRISENHK